MLVAGLLLHVPIYRSLKHPINIDLWLISSIPLFFPPSSALSLSSHPMDSVSPPAEHLCYVRCNYCNTVLAVGVPCKRLMDTVTVKCGHCNNLSFLSTRPVMHTHLPDFQMGLGIQASCHDYRKGQPSSPTSPTPNLEMTPKAHHVVKPPERKHRVPSAYNRFMKEEIQRIKAAQPDIPHREAFSMAAKNWAKSDTHAPNGSTSDHNSHKALKVTGNINHEKPKAAPFVVDGFDAVNRSGGGGGRI